MAGRGKDLTTDELPVLRKRTRRSKMGSIAEVAMNNIRAGA
jgi:hypothetical protein